MPARRPQPPVLSLPRPAAMTAAAARRSLTSRARAGFTLIEMLIAVTLVLLMMTLFAQVFGLATESMSARKGMAANDQKGRLLADRFAKDFDARTVRRVMPFAGAQLTYQPAFQTAGDPSTPIVGWEPKQAEAEGEFVYTDSALTTALWEARVPEVPEDTERLGYWTFSENDPDDDGDDVLTFTTDRTRRAKRADADFSPARGRAAVIVATGAGVKTLRGGGVVAPVPGQPALDTLSASGAREGEAYGSGAMADVGYSVAGDPYGDVGAAATAAVAGVDPVGESAYEVVSYFLRDGNLIRKRRLIREPVTTAADYTAMFDGPDGDTDPDDWPPVGLTAADADGDGRADAVGRFFDYAMYRLPGADGPRFHSAEQGLSNRAGGPNFNSDFDGDGLDELRLPISLGNPYLRDGAGFFAFDVTSTPSVRPLGRPREFARKVAGPSLGFRNAGAAVGLADAEWDLPDNRGPAPFVGRYLGQEESVTAFHLPGRDLFNLDAIGGNAAASPTFAPDLTDIGGNVAPWYAYVSPTTRIPRDPRRGEEILVANVHGLDIEVYDDAIGDFVDLGHSRTVSAPDLFDVDGDGSVSDALAVAGDYHADRLVAVNNIGPRPALGLSAGAIDLNGDGPPDVDYDGDGNPDPHPFGNRFDTWHPEMNLMGVGYVDADGDPTTPGSRQVAVVRPYPPPYRVLRNPLGGDVGVPTRNAGGGIAAIDLSFSGTGLRYVANARIADDARLGGRLAATTEAIYNDNDFDGAGSDDVFLDPAVPYFTAPGAEGTDDDGLTFGVTPGTLRTLATTGTNEQDFARGVNAAGDPRLFPDPNEYGAYGSDDEKPLRAVRVTVRYYDVQSDRMRQESFRHSLID